MSKAYDEGSVVFALRAIGGPTALLSYGGLRLLTDPTFSEPGEYQSASGVLTKLAGPAVAAPQIGPLDAVLLSHDQHVDNLDPAGRDLLRQAQRVLTTVDGAERLEIGATGLSPYDSVSLPRPEGGFAVVTAVPAEHGPPEIAARIGPVIGFVLQADGLPTVYISGDNASLEIVREIAERNAPIDVAVLFAGGALVREAFGDAHLTLGATAAAEAAQILRVATVIPVHQDGWAHLSEGVDDVSRAFAEAGIAERLRIVEPGATVLL